MRTLLLGRGCNPLTLISWEKAVRLLVLGKAEPFSEKTSKKVATKSGAFWVPAVIRLVYNTPWRAAEAFVGFSRRRLLVRDGHSCRYCGAKLGKNEITIDHVIPKSKGGKTTYQNCVICCRDCNNKKGNKTPDEAGMPLLEKPVRPTILTLYRKQIPEELLTEWEAYF